jgi:transcription initiation factor TFIIIB Brf1 subunit/transcription initiation factor TFIIB
LGDASGVDPKIFECANATSKKLGENVSRYGNDDDLRRLTLIDVLNYASKVWKGQELLAKTAASEAVRIIREAHEKVPSFFWDKSRKWLLGGLFYLIGKKMNVPKTQKQIAKCLDTDEITIRDSYREWLVHFPEFWPETVTHPKERQHSKTSKGSFNSHSKRMAKFL